MKHRWFCLASLLACLVMVFATAGCSGDGSRPTTFEGPTASSTGFVKLRMTAVPTRQGIPLELQATFTEIALLNANTSDTAPTPVDWHSVLAPSNPNIPIPILEGPKLVDLMTGGANPQTTEVATTEVPAQLYSKIRLLLAPEFEESLQELPLDMSKFKNIIPITGGMQVNPEQTVTLLVDFFNGNATVVDDN